MLSYFYSQKELPTFLKKLNTWNRCPVGTICYSLAADSLSLAWDIVTKTCT